MLVTESKEATYYIVHLKCKFVSDMDKGKGNVAPARDGKKRKKSEMMLELWGPRNNSTTQLHVGGHKCVGNHDQGTCSWSLQCLPSVGL